MMKRVTVSLPDDLIVYINEKRKTMGLTQSAYIALLVYNQIEILKGQVLVTPDETPMGGNN